MAQEAQLHWFEAVLVFANYSDLPDDLVGDKWILLRNELTAAGLFSINGLAGPDNRWRLFDYLDDWNDVDTIRDEQNRLRKMLHSIATEGKASQEMLLQLAVRTTGIPVSGFVFFQLASKHSMVQTDIRPESIGDWYTFAIAELVSLGLDTRLGQCALISCKKFFLNFSNRGPKQRYCCRSHGSQVRVAKKRKKDKRARIAD